MKQKNKNKWKVSQLVRAACQEEKRAPSLTSHIYGTYQPAHQEHLKVQGRKQKGRGSHNSNPKEIFTLTKTGLLHGNITVIWLTRTVVSSIFWPPVAALSKLLLSTIPVMGEEEIMQHHRFYTVCIHFNGRDLSCLELRLGISTQYL